MGLGQQVRRYELLSAADHRPAYRGDFTRALIETLRRGITSAGATIDASDLREPLHDGAQELARIPDTSEGICEEGKRRPTSAF